MEYEDYTIVEQKTLVPDVFSLKVKPTNGGDVFSYTAGQFAQIKNPTYERPDEPHSFSIASSPLSRDHLEFCYKTYGNWTKSISQKQPGETLLMQGPLGRFTWDESVTSAVFLAGGVGIVPMLSMLRYNAAKHITTPVVLLYGNRTEADIAYRNELSSLISQLPNSRIINILSDIKPEDPWAGYRGFITKEILEKEVDFSSPASGSPTFFLCGPPIFVQLMRDLLKGFNVPTEKVKQELFSSPPAPKSATQEVG